MTITDLEYAARAAKRAGLDIEFDAESGKAFDSLSNEWDPRLHDGEAFRLAVALGLTTRPHLNHMQAFRLGYRSTKSSVPFPYNPDKPRFDQPQMLAAARLAVFKSAVFIERSEK